MIQKTNKKEIPYRRSLTIDLDTKNKHYKKSFYVDIKMFLLENGFIHLKDSDYESRNKLFQMDLDKLERKFIEKYWMIGLCQTKFDWDVIDNENQHHRSAVIYKKSKIQQEKQLKKDRGMEM